LAQQHNLPLIVTTGPAGVHKLFSQYPGAKMLLAHAGTYAKEPISNPGDLASLFDQYQNLSIDLAQLDSRFPALNIAPNGLLKPEWRDLFLKYPDRIMIGSDPLVAANWKNYSKYMDEIRGWLNQLPTNVGQQIAYQNANRFFGGCAKSFKLP
jgi:predicted TIM-barrel fold metal-dependent hydrolase